MDISKLTAVILVLGFTLLGCQQQQANQQELQSGGLILSGELSGSEFTIATGDELDHFMQMVEAFNQMDAAAIWEFSADSVSILGAEGNLNYVTQADFEGMFSTIDSLSWEIDAAIPVQVTGTDIVKILADTREVMNYKDGTVMRVRLMEEFTFEDGLLTGVRQWTAELPEDM
ncbi:hypothetical protein [Rhodohalobacter sp.]|uniref:hypothetical protein n=1 Tax=Rhodohalobacter sp. TaxID=1974210 RepID=UPI002ACD70D7|nr:hypothetical protein [Rhodohalobacter sp.]MDZ7755990.1 hypothetical protein [Rhodohalobacter sp.]